MATKHKYNYLTHTNRRLFFFAQMRKKGKKVKKSAHIVYDVLSGLWNESYFSRYIEITRDKMLMLCGISAPSYATALTFLEEIGLIKYERGNTYKKSKVSFTPIAEDFHYKYLLEKNGLIASETDVQSSPQAAKDVPGNTETPPPPPPIPDNENVPTTANGVKFPGRYSSVEGVCAFYEKFIHFSTNPNDITNFNRYARVVLGMKKINANTRTGVTFIKKE